jgi:hypothetical protein
MKLPIAMEVLPCLRFLTRAPQLGQATAIASKLGEVIGIVAISEAVYSPDGAIAITAYHVPESRAIVLGISRFMESVHLQVAVAQVKETRLNSSTESQICDLQTELGSGPNTPHPSEVKLLEIASGLG